jgi:glycoside/pentoside/hexuronide:cation symporter, GPH family
MSSEDAQPATIFKSRTSIGRRATGLVFSASTLAFKAGVALGGFISLQVLARFGYVANQDQVPAVLEVLRPMMSTIPAVGGFLCIGALLLYPLTRAQLLRIETELKARPEHREDPVT